MKLLEARGAATDYHDPLVLEVPKTREYPELAGKRSVELEPKMIESYDALVMSPITTESTGLLLSLMGQLLLTPVTYVLATILLVAIS